MSSDAGGALDRVAGQVGGTDVVDRLAALSGSDFTSLMLEVVRRRAARQTPPGVLRRYERDRFVRPGSAPWRSVRRAEDLLLGCLPPDVEVVQLAPLVPLGTHSALGTVSQHKVVAAIRACEVAADPTNALALEAATRRAAQLPGAHPGDTTVRLAAVQRVTRAQRFPDGWAAHFGLFAMVTAGRDEGGNRFGQAALAGHLRVAIAGLRAAGLTAQVALTPLTQAGEQLADTLLTDMAVPGQLAGDPASIVMDTGRASGRGYYRDLCFKVNALVHGQPAEIGDGGFTNWTARLLSNEKERLLISGYGLDRLAALMAAPGTREE